MILSLDWVDLAGLLKGQFQDDPIKAKVISVTNDFRIHRGWSMDYQGLPPVDVLLPVTPDEAVPDLLKALGATAKALPPARGKKIAMPELSKDKLVVNDLVRALRFAVGDRDVTLAHISLSWDGETWPFRHPLDYVGAEGGGGVGGGPGNSVGTALALKGSGRFVAAVCGDGDFMMANTAIWTAAHYKIPLLIVVANNRSFFNDELHQERVARIRSRPPENRWIGQRISEPDIDIAGLARSQGGVGFGPVTKTARPRADLREGNCGSRGRQRRGRRRPRRARLLGDQRKRPCCAGRKLRRRSKALVPRTRCSAIALHPAEARGAVPRFGFATVQGRAVATIRFACSCCAAPGSHRPNISNRKRLVRRGMKHLLRRHEPLRQVLPNGGDARTSPAPCGSAPGHSSRNRAPSVRVRL